jgi:hypothetical protein
MSKFSILTVFLSATIVVIVAELLVNEYAKYPLPSNSIKANVLAEETVANTSQTQTTTQEPAAKTVPAATNNEPKAKITFELINKAGFTGASLQITPFGGILFESVDLRGFKSVNIISNNLLVNNRDKIASFYEFKAGNKALSDEIFKMLKEKFGGLINAGINDTNTFGDASFYVNFSERPNDTFLVVKADNDVYALTYKKEYHPNIKKLLWEINPTNN